MKWWVCWFTSVLSAPTMVFHHRAFVYGVFPEIQNCEDAPSRDGDAIPWTMPCSPAGPNPSTPAQTSQDCQSLRFSMLATVVPSTLGWEAATALDWAIGGIDFPPQPLDEIAIEVIRKERAKWGSPQRAILVPSQM